MARDAIYLFNGIFHLAGGYFHNCDELSPKIGWYIVNNKCWKCGKEVPSKEKLDVMRGLKEVVGDIDG